MILSSYVIYQNTKDYPGVFCCRRHEIHSGFTAAAELIGTADTLEAMREKLPSPYLYCVPRSPQDDPVIVETWL